MLSARIYLLVLFNISALMINDHQAQTTTGTQPTTGTTPTTDEIQETCEIGETEKKSACEKAFSYIEDLCYDYTSVCSDLFAIPDVKQRDGFFAIRNLALYAVYAKCGQIEWALDYYRQGVQLEKDKNSQCSSTSPASTSTPSTGTPSNGTPSTGTPSTGTPSTGNPSTGTPSTGTPSTTASSNPTPSSP